MPYQYVCRVSAVMNSLLLQYVVLRTGEHRYPPGQPDVLASSAAELELYVGMLVAMGEEQAVGTPGPNRCRAHQVHAAHFPLYTGARSKAGSFLPSSLHELFK